MAGGSKLAERTFDRITINWRLVDDAELYKTIGMASTWAKWPEHTKIIDEMKAEFVRRFTSKYGTELDGHAIFAPSASHEWAFCSRSLVERLQKGDTAGIDAAMGTVAHTIAEQWNKTGKEPRYLLGTKMSAMAGGKSYEFEIDETWLANCGKFVDWCAELPGDHFFEQRVDFSELMPIPNQKGTADFFALWPRNLVLRDFKNGMVRVYAERNPQMMLYAAAIFLEYDWIYGFERIVLSICQPRLDVFDVWECSRQDLLDFMDEIRAAAWKALDPNASRTPGEKQCRYCGGNKTCAARVMALEAALESVMLDDAEDLQKSDFSAVEVDAARERIEKKGMSVDAISTYVPKDLSVTALERILLQRKTVEAFFKGVYEEVLRRAENGHRLQFHFLGEGRATYDWIDEDAAVEAIVLEYGIPSNKIRPPAMLSKDQVEKLIKAEAKEKPAKARKFLEPYLKKFAGKRSLKRVGEDGDDASANVDAMFGDDADYDL